MKTLNVLQVFKDFEGNPMKDGDKPFLILKNVLITYIQTATGLNESERNSAYLAGLAIGMGGEECRLETDQYDLVKRLVDKNKVTNNGAEIDMYNVLISQQTKSMVDGAVDAKKK